MNKYTSNKIFWFTLFIIIFSINVVYGDGWSIVTPRKDQLYQDGSTIDVCWKCEGDNAICNQNITITLHSQNSTDFNSGYILGDKLSASNVCYSYGVKDLDKSKIKNGSKIIKIWDSKKNLLIETEEFVVNRKTKATFDFGKLSYIVIGAAVIIPVILVLMFNYKRKAAAIPMGSRSLPSLTVNRRKTYEPPIKSYRESWIELPQANVSADSIEEVYDYDLLEEAEEAAKSMGLLDKVWKAKKTFIPSRDDELLIRAGDELIVREIYDDLWCYGQNKTLFEEKEAKENRKIEYNNDLSIQENEELAMFGMFPSVVLPIEFKNLKVTKETIQSIREASVAAEPIHDDVENEDVVLKQDPNSVVIKIPSPPENMILPVNNLKRSTSLRSSLHRRATQRTNVSISSTPAPSSRPLQSLQPLQPLQTSTQTTSQSAQSNDKEK